jgi:hypothetical protein
MHPGSQKGQFTQQSSFQLPSNRREKLKKGNTGKLMAALTCPTSGCDAF